MTRRSDELQEALREIREQHLKTVAPARVGIRLRTAARWKGILTPLKRPLQAIAAGAVILLFVQSQRSAFGPGVDKVRPDDPASYIELPVSAALPAPSATIVLRVQLRRGDLRQYGLVVPPFAAAELLDVDFLVGEDGLARGVRIVQ
jgi:hypothetical protein